MENKLSSIFVLIFIVFIAGLSFWLSLEVKKELTDTNDESLMMKLKQPVQQISI